MQAALHKVPAAAPADFAQGPRSGLRDRLYTQDEASRTHALAILSYEECESEVAVPEVFYLVKPGDERVRNDNRLGQLNYRHVHSFDPPAGYMSLQETVKNAKDGAANHINSEGNGAFAELTGSIAAFRKNLPQIRNQLASRINREYYSPDDTALFLNVNHSDNSDISVDGFDFSIGREGVRLDDGFRYGSRIVRFSHGGAPS